MLETFADLYWQSDMLGVLKSDFGTGMQDELVIPWKTPCSLQPSGYFAAIVDHQPAIQGHEQAALAPQHLFEA